MTARHPLKGKLLRWSDEDFESYTLRRFLEPVAEGFWLTQGVSPHTGEDMPEQYIMCLGEIAHGERGEIYENWDAMQAADVYTKIVHNLHELNGKVSEERERQITEARRREIKEVKPDPGGAA